MRFDATSIALVKKSSLLLAVAFTLLGLYFGSLQVVGFGLLTIAFVPLSVWGIDSFGVSLWLSLHGFLGPLQHKIPDGGALIASAGQHHGIPF